jgi:hypothetical protein
MDRDWICRRSPRNPPVLDLSWATLRLSHQLKYRLRLFQLPPPHQRRPHLRLRYLRRLRQTRSWRISQLPLLSLSLLSS